MVWMRLLAAISCLSYPGFIYPVHSAYAALAATSETADPGRRLCFEISPLSLLYGVYGGQVGFRLGSAWGLGASFQWFGLTSNTQVLTASEAGVFGSVFPLGRTSAGGYYIRPAFKWLPISVHDRTGLNGTRTADIYSVGTTVGRQWMTDIGLNFNLGAGLSFHHAPRANVVWISSTGTLQQVVLKSDEVQPLIEATIGWAL